MPIKRLARDAFTACLDLTGEEAGGMVSFVRRCYSPAGRSTAAVEPATIEAMREALGVDAPPAEALYAPSHDP